MMSTEGAEGVQSEEKEAQGGLFHSLQLPKGKVQPGDEDWSLLPGDK